MYEEEYPIAIAAYHSDDEFACIDSEERLDAMGINAYPTIIPDGMAEPTYPYTHQILENTINERLSAPAACTISPDGELIGNQLDMIITVIPDISIPMPNPRLQIVITESHLDCDNPNYEEINFACRDMIPDHEGIDFIGSEPVEIPVTIIFESSWNLGNIDLVVFVENANNRQVYQATTISLMAMSDFPPPINLTANAVGEEIHLSWQAPSSRTLSGYNIYRDNLLHDFSPDTNYVDVDIEYLVTYSYFVTAVYEDPDGESPYSNSATATVLDPDLQSVSFTAPDTPEQQVYPNNTNPFGNSYTDFGWTAIEVDQEGTVGYINIQCNWNSVDYPGEGSLRISSPDGSDYLVYQSTGTGVTPLNIDVIELVGESITGTWIVYMLDSYGDGGHQITDFIATFYYADGGEELLPPTNLAIDNSTAHLTWSAPSRNGIILNDEQDNNDLTADRELTGYNVYLDEVLVITTSDNEYTFTGLTADQDYTAGVEAVYTSGNSEIVELDFVYEPVATNDNEITKVTTLKGNFPNPFNPSTTICFSTKDEGLVTIDIFNLRGEKVRTLINLTLPADEHSITWEGKDDANKAVSSGIYLLRMNTDRYTSTKKMLLIK